MGGHDDSVDVLQRRCESQVRSEELFVDLHVLQKRPTKSLGPQNTWHAIHLCGEAVCKDFLPAGLQEWLTKLATSSTEVPNGPLPSR